MNILKTILKTCIEDDNNGSFNWNEWRLLSNIKLLKNIYVKLQKNNFSDIDYVISLGKSGIIIGSIISHILNRPLLMLGGKYPDDPHNMFVHPRNNHLNGMNILLVDTLLKRGAVLYHSIDILKNRFNLRPKKISVFVLLNIECWKERGFIKNINENIENNVIEINSLYSINKDMSIFEEVFSKLNVDLEKIEKIICDEKDFWTYHEKKENESPSDVNIEQSGTITSIYGNYIDVKRKMNILDFYNDIIIKKVENCDFCECNGWNKYTEFLSGRYDNNLREISNTKYDYIATTQLSYLPIIIYISLKKNISAFFAQDQSFEKESTFFSNNIDIKRKKFCLVSGETNEVRTIRRCTNLIIKKGGIIENSIFFLAQKKHHHVR